MEEQRELRRIVGLLGDANRFRVVAAISLGAGTIAKVAAMTGLDDAKIVKAIVRLETAGLIENREDVFIFRIDMLRDLAKRFSEATGRPKLGQVDRFIRDGHLVAFPRVPKDRLLVLNHIADLFEHSRRYAEKEVNDKLKVLNPDCASLRRYLVDYGFLKRENITDDDGPTAIVYWRI